VGGDIMHNENLLLTENQALTPDEVSFVREAETTYLNLFGGGLMLNELERMAFERWAREKIPLDLLKRAMSIACEANRKNQRGPFGRRPSIRFTEAILARELKSAKTKAVGAPAVETTPDPGLEERRRVLCERLAEEGKAERDTMIREAYRRAYRKLLRLKADHEMVGAVRRLDEILCDEIYNVIKPDLREQIDEQVQEAVKEISATADRDALHDFVKATRRREVRQRLQLFKLVL
jgi:hypothetical protein